MLRGRCGSRSVFVSDRALRKFQGMAGDDWDENINGAGPDSRKRVDEAGRNRHHLVSVRTKCWRTRHGGLHRQNCVTKLKGMKVMGANSGRGANCRGGG